MIRTSLLLTVALAYSAAMVFVGRRLQRPASLAAYTTALAILLAVPLFPEATVRHVDRVLGVVGAGRLLVHLAFMTALSGLFLTVVLATQRWAWRHRWMLSGVGVLMGLFVVCWRAVQTLHLSDMAAVFYGHGASPPTPVLWMNSTRGAGIVYIAAWGLAEFHDLRRRGRSAYEDSMVRVALLLYGATGLIGTLTIVESVGRHRGLDMAVPQQVRIAFTTWVLAGTAVVLVSQIRLQPLGRRCRQLLARSLDPELAQLRHDLLNLTAAQAELHLDIHHVAYANHAIVDDVVTRCRAAGIDPARVAMARMATSLLTFHRDNLLQDPSYGLVTSWEELMEEAATGMDQAMARTAWEQALRDGYISQQVYILMFLVLDSRAYREILLIDERPRVEGWHQQLADLIATVMHAHGHATPRYGQVARQTTQGHRLAWLRARRTASGRAARAGRSLHYHEDERHRGEGTPTT